MKKKRLHKRIKEIVQHDGLEYSTPEIQRNIQEYGVLVDDAMEHKRLLWVEDFQTISIEHWPRNKEALIEDIPIFFEDDDLFIFDKPYGLAVQPGVGHLRNNLVAYLSAQFPDQESLPDCGLVHRLDINTQGLIIVAKHVEVYSKLKQIFKDRKIKKSYLALVHGHMSEVDLEYYQTRSLINPTKQKGYIHKENAEKKHNKVRYCHTKFSPIYFSKELKQTLVRVHILTGRTHQIRVSAEMLGHPLVNDPTYASQINKVSRYKENIGTSQFLDLERFTQLVKHISQDHEYCLVSNSLEFSLSQHYCFEKYQGELE